jgi:holo-[acyl-carrier protein] synthase
VIVGVGVDVVDIERFGASLERTPGLGARLFTEDELAAREIPSLAARFAAKEALAKALGAPGTLQWHDAVVVTEESGRPVLRVTGTVAAAAAAQGIRAWHLSLSHDGGIATAFVVAES